MKRKRIDMQKLDPNWKFAQQHGNASMTGVQSSSKDVHRGNSIMLCPCCLKAIHKDPVPLCENPKQLSFLGYGFPLFYNMLQYCLISLFILILSESSILLYLSIQQICPEEETHRLLAQKDLSYPCESFFVKISRVTGDTKDFQFDRIIRVLSFIGQSFLMIYLRDVQRKLASYHTERNTRIKDFSVIFRDLPKMKGIQKRIRSFMASLKMEEEKLKIEQIFLMPKIDYFHELQGEKKQVIQHMKRNMEAGTFTSSLKDALFAQLDRVNLQLLQTCKKTEALYQKDQLFSQKAIIILENKYQKQQVIKQWQNVTTEHKSQYFAWMADEVSLTSAPQPRQIIWQNINYPKYKRWIRVVIGWIFTFLFLAVTTGVFYFLVDFRASSHSVTVLVITLILIQFFNKFIMKIFLHWFSDLEMPETSSDRQFSYAFKYTIGMFFTTAIMSLIVQAGIFQNYQYQFGIVEGQTIMFFFNAFVVNLLWIFHPQYYIKKFQRWRKYGSKTITQREANELMQEYPYDMGKRYAEIVQTMWFTFLYASLIPFGSLLSFFGLCMYYWVDKYNLLRRSKVQNTIESKLPLQAVKLMQITLFWKPLGQLIFDLSLRNTFYIQTLVMIGLSLVFLILPWNIILDKLFYQKFNMSSQTYQQVKFRFTETYQTVDPIQRMLALEKFIEQQNKARKQYTNPKENNTMLEIRNYDDDQKRSQGKQQKIGRKMTKEQASIDPVFQDDYSIVLKYEQSDNSGQVTRRLSNWKDQDDSQQ